MKRNVLVVTLIALVFVNSSFAEYSRNHPKDNHTKSSQQEEDQELRSARRRNRVGSRRGRSGGRRSGGSSNCDPLYSYLFGSCGHGLSQGLLETTLSCLGQLPLPARLHRGRQLCSLFLLIIHSFLYRHRYFLPLHLQCYHHPYRCLHP